MTDGSDWRDQARLQLAFFHRLHQRVYNLRSPAKLLESFLLSFLHTYLVWVAAIKKAVHHGLVPALHSAAEQSVQRPSGH